MTQDDIDVISAIAVIKCLTGINEEDAHTYINDGNPGRNARRILGQYGNGVVGRLGKDILEACLGMRDGILDRVDEVRGKFVPIGRDDIDQCQDCSFYHGQNGICCSLHPAGPVSKNCGDRSLGKTQRVL